MAGQDGFIAVLSPTGGFKGKPPANTKLYEVLGWLETAREHRVDASAVIDTAQAAASYGDALGARRTRGPKTILIF